MKSQCSHWNNTVDPWRERQSLRFESHFVSLVFISAPFKILTQELYRRKRLRKAMINRPTLIEELMTENVLPPVKYAAERRIPTIAVFCFDAIFRSFGRL